MYYGKAGVDCGYATFIEIDLDNIYHNIKAIQSYLGSAKEIMAVVKANAYGHGAIEISKTALDAGATSLAVAILEEALQLRTAGITAPILVLGYTKPNSLELAIINNISLTISSVEDLSKIGLTSSALNRKVFIHLKIDTGMGRLGIQPNELGDFFEELAKYPSIQLEGIYTHFATADEEDTSYAYMQRDIFNDCLAKVQNYRPLPRSIHNANSAATLQNLCSNSNLVRIGLAMYGIYPSDTAKKSNVILQAALTWKSMVAHLKIIPKGTSIGYGRAYTSPESRWIATIPVGYADGYNRLLSNRGQVLIGGRRVPVVGRISMDQITVDVSEALPVKKGDEVILYGPQGGDKITLYEVADSLDTIPYELFCSLSLRRPRIYIKDGEIVSIANNLG